MLEIPSTVRGLIIANLLSIAAFVLISLAGSALMHFVLWIPFDAFPWMEVRFGAVAGLVVGIIFSIR